MNELISWRHAVEDRNAPEPVAGDGVNSSSAGQRWCKHVPIRALGERHRPQIAQHLLALDAHDRYLRFGYLATDPQVKRYVDGLDFERDEILGIFNRKLLLIAVAHLAYVDSVPRPASAEFGISVLKASRGKGHGGRMFERAAMDARNKQVRHLHIYALTENTAMIKIARNAGAAVVRNGSESEAFLRLPRASLNSRMAEIMEDHYAQVDYRLKSHSKQFRDFLVGIRAIQDT